MKWVNRKYKLFPLQKGDVKDTYASVHKISKITKYKPKVSLQNGIKDYINCQKLLLDRLFLKIFSLVEKNKLRKKLYR